MACLFSGPPSGDPESDPNLTVHQQTIHGGVVTRNERIWNVSYNAISPLTLAPLGSARRPRVGRSSAKLCHVIRTLPASKVCLLPQGQTCSPGFLKRSSSSNRLSARGNSRSPPYRVRGQSRNLARPPPDTA